MTSTIRSQALPKTYVLIVSWYMADENLHSDTDLLLELFNDPNRYIVDKWLLETFQDERGDFAAQHSLMKKLDNVRVRCKRTNSNFIFCYTGYGTTRSPYLGLELTLYE